MNNTIQIGPVVIALQDFLKSNNILRTWDYKLDSFFKDVLPAENAIRICKAKNSGILEDKNSSNIFQTLKKKDSMIQLESLNAGFYDRQFYKSENGYYFRFSRRVSNESTLLFHINPDWNQITLLKDLTDTDGAFAFEYLSSLISYSMLTKDVLSLHGVLMEYNGQGIIFSANSGVGKTTHARLWKKHKNSFIINGDKSCCYKKDGIWIGFGTPWCGTSGEYMNREVPIKAIVLIERGSENYAEKINPFTGFKRLLEHTLYPAWDMNLTNQAMDLLSDFIENIPVYRLECLPDKDSVDVLEKVIFRNE